MRKLRIVLKENKNVSLLTERGILSGNDEQFADYLALERFLNSTTDTKLKTQWAAVQRQAKFVSGSPANNAADYTKFGQYIENIQGLLIPLRTSDAEAYSFIEDLIRDVPSVQTFFLAYGDNFNSINKENIAKLMADFYKASVVPHMVLNTPQNVQKINSVDYAFASYLRTMLEQIGPTYNVLSKAVETAKSRQGSGWFGMPKISKALMGDGNDEVSRANAQLKRLFASWINGAIGKKREGDALSQSIVNREEAGGERPPAPPPEGAGGGERPPAPPPEGAGGGGGGEPPPAGTPSSRVIPISSELYRTLTSSGIAPSVAREIVRALKNDLEASGYMYRIRESLQTTKPTLTDILLREEYLYTSALHDLLLLERRNTQAIRRGNYERKINQLSNKPQNRKQSLESLDAIEKDIKNDYEKNLLRNDDLTTLQSALENRREKLGGKAKAETSPIKDDSPSAPEPVEAPIESTPEETPETPSSGKVDYWNRYFVDKEKHTIKDTKKNDITVSDYFKQILSLIDNAQIEDLDPIKDKGLLQNQINDIIRQYTHWVISTKSAVEKAVGSTIPQRKDISDEDIKGIKEAEEKTEKTGKTLFRDRINPFEKGDGHEEQFRQSVASGKLKAPSADTEKDMLYNKRLKDFNSKTGGTFLRNYTNLLTAVKKIRELILRPENAEIDDKRAMPRHISAAFPKELGFDDAKIKKLTDLFMAYVKDVRPKKAEVKYGLTKTVGKDKTAINHNALVAFIKGLTPKEESERGKKINPNIAVSAIKKFLQPYGIRLAESRYIQIANIAINESYKHYGLVREFHEHVNNNLLPYMQKQIGFNRPPTINFIDDPVNAQSPFAKTAHYDPQSMEITVYTTGRHPKDIMRSVAHEVIHHAQNCRGQLDPQRMGEASEGYAQKNPYLRKLEEEAYLLGNMTFRDWEDGMKNKQLNEAHDCNKVHPNKSHAAYKRDDEAKKQEKPLDEWINEERWDLLMKRFKIVSEKRFANDPKLDKDGDGKPKWADEDDDEAEVNEKKLSKSETKEKEKIVKGMKKSKEDFEERYPGRGKEVMYATATKKAMEKK